jgi:hypothetical protein
VQQKPHPQNLINLVNAKFDYEIQGIGRSDTITMRSKRAA